MQKIPDIIIERAVELWCRALRYPRHDNGDRSERGVLSAGLAGMVLDQQMADVDDYPAAIERFRTILTAKLKWQRDHEGEKGVYLECDLRTDYHPNPILAEAANKARVPDRAFSWKSSVSFYSGDCVASSFGYGVEPTYHYPMSGGRWLLTKLRGFDMPAIVAAVEQGRLPELTVEVPNG